MLFRSPILAVLVIAPPALGAYTAARQPRARAAPPPDAFGPLRGGDPVGLSLVEFDLRSLDRDGATLRGRTVAVTGFVADSDAGGFVLVRLVITCCAADASAVEIDIRTRRPSPGRNRWVRVLGRYAGHAPGGQAVLVARSLRPVAQPINPYNE